MESISASKLAPLVGISDRSICRLLAQHNCPKVERHGFEFWPAIRTLIQHYKDEAESLDRQTKENRAAITANDRALSDVRTQSALGKVMRTADAIAIGQPIVTAIRQRIMSSSMTPDEKAELCRDLAKMGEIDWVARAKELANSNL